MQWAIDGTSCGTSATCSNAWSSATAPRWSRRIPTVAATPASSPRPSACLAAKAGAGDDQVGHHQGQAVDHRGLPVAPFFALPSARGGKPEARMRS
jgi:hypothetical protein